jgi:hypothetical protein
MGASDVDSVAALRGASASAGLVVKGSLDDLDRLIKDLQGRRGIRVAFVRVSLGRLRVVTEPGQEPTAPEGAPR